MCRSLLFAMMSAACILSAACSNQQQTSQQVVPVSPAPQLAISPRQNPPATARTGQALSQSDPALEEAWRNAEGEIASGLRAVQGSYKESEIRTGAKPRNWPDLRLPGTGVTAKLTTTWNNLAVDYQLILSGNHQNIENFLEQHPRMRVRFAQPNGVTTTQFAISADEFRLSQKSAKVHATSQAVAVGNTQSGLLRYLQADRWYIVWLE